jgi:hypothetical protein
MKAHHLGQGRHLLDTPPKQLEAHHLFFANDLGTKTALQIADIADLDIDLGEFSQ